MTSSSKTTLCRWAGSSGPVTRGASNSTSRSPCLSNCGKENIQNNTWPQEVLQGGSWFPTSPRARLRVSLPHSRGQLGKGPGQVLLDPLWQGQAGCEAEALPLILAVATLVYHFLPFSSWALSFPVFLFSYLYFWSAIHRSKLGPLHLSPKHPSSPSPPRKCAPCVLDQPGGGVSPTGPVRQGQLWLLPGQPVHCRHVHDGRWGQGRNEPPDREGRRNPELIKRTSCLEDSV